MRTAWTVQVVNEAGQWADICDPTRLSKAHRIWKGADEPKALALNGRRIKMRTTDEQLDVFNER